MYRIFVSLDGIENIEMKVGNRFAIPVHYGLPHDWAEMRLIGTYPACTLHAVIYRLLELHSDSTFKLKHPQAASEVLRRMITDEDDLHTINTAPLYCMQQQGNLAQNIEQFATNAMKGAYFDLQENIASVEYWNIRVEVPQTNFSLCPNAEVEVGLYISENNVFVLYRDFTRDSFLELPCEHVGLKYDYFAAFQQAIGATAISESESQSYLLRCLDCNKVFPAKTIFQCAVETAQFITTRSQRSTQYQCLICGKSTQNLSGCSSKHRVCDNCFLKNYMTDRYEYLPCCAELITREKWLDVTAKIASSFQLYSHLSNRSFVCTEESTQIDRFALVEGAPTSTKVIIEPPSDDRRREEEPYPGCNMPSICRTCEHVFTSEDKDNQCPTCCECKLCVIAWIGGLDTGACRYCRREYYPGLIKKLQMYRRCHFCGLSLSINEVIVLELCITCKACAKITRSKPPSVMCRLCQKPLQVQEDTVKQIKNVRKFLTRACCNISESNPHSFRLSSCPHDICYRHAGILKRCRKCKKNVE